MVDGSHMEKCIEATEGLHTLDPAIGKDIVKHEKMDS